MRQKPSADEEFIVKDSVFALLLMAVALSAMLFSAILYNTKQGNIFVAGAIGAVPLIFVLIKLKNRKPAIVINRNGIFSAGSKVSDWNHFVSARFTQKHKRLISISDDFVLIIEYRKDGFPGLFRITIPLTNTQNKSEEAVLAAVYHHYEKYQKETKLFFN